MCVLFIFVTVVVAAVIDHDNTVVIDFIINVIPINLIYSFRISFPKVACKSLSSTYTWMNVNGLFWLLIRGLSVSVYVSLFELLKFTRRKLTFPHEKVENCMLWYAFSWCLFISVYSYVVVQSI